MTRVRTLVYRSKVIVPPEASAIADRLRQISELGETVATDLSRLQSQLSAVWEGQAKEQFMLGFDARPGTAHSDADLVSHQADRIASMRVTVWDTTWEWIEVTD